MDGWEAFGVIVAVAFVGCVVVFIDSGSICSFLLFALIVFSVFAVTKGLSE